MPPKAAKKPSNIFRDLSFHYSKKATGYKQIKDAILSRGGTMVDHEHIARVKLAPSGQSHKLPAEGEFVDVLYIEDCILANKLVDEEKYRISRENGTPVILWEREFQANQAAKKGAANPTSETRERSPKATRINAAGSATSPKKSQSSEPLSPARAPRREIESTSPYNSSFPLVEGVSATQVDEGGVRVVCVPRDAHPAISRNRTLFNEEDDMKIIHVIETNPYTRDLKNNTTVAIQPNGHKFWMNCVRDGLLPAHRTWQGWQGRFKKHMLPHDKYFVYLKRYREILAENPNAFSR